MGLNSLADPYVADTQKGPLTCAADPGGGDGEVLGKQWFSKLMEEGVWRGQGR